MASTMSTAPPQAPAGNFPPWLCAGGLSRLRCTGEGLNQTQGTGALGRGRVELKSLPDRIQIQVLVLKGHRRAQHAAGDWQRIKFGAIAGAAQCAGDLDASAEH